MVLSRMPQILKCTCKAQALVYQPYLKSSQKEYYWNKFFLPLLLLQRKSPTCRLQHKDRIINDQIESVIMGQPKEYNSSLQKVVLNENYS